MREDNAALDKTVLIEYDGSGNIICKQEFPYTRAEKDALVDDRSKLCWYEYTDGDRLVSFGGERVGGYDPLGNPHLYRGKNLTWTRGSRLDNFDNVRFEYNMAGIRTSKTVDSELTKYFLDGDRILLERTPNRELLYTYGMGGVTGLTLKDSDGKCAYHFRKNIQGDVTHILDSSGKVVAEYVYDAWGNHKVLDENGEVNDRSDFIGNINPWRYRGYYWDKETGLYYLQSRYYDPEVGRFISADSIEYLDPETINGLNLYAYCGNNPVNMVDSTGHAPWWQWLISSLQLAAGIALCFVPGGQGQGIGLIIGGTLGLIANATAPEVGQGIGGASSMVNGWGAISTGISLFSFGIPGAIAGIICIGIGIATMAFGVNEIVDAATGTNYFQQWTGMSDGVYQWHYIGLNIASTLVTISGRLGMRAAGTKTIGSHDKLSLKGQKPYARITRGSNTTNFDGRGRASWSKHNALHGGRVGNPHWHIERPNYHSPELNFWQMLLRLIFGGWRK